MAITGICSDIRVYSAAQGGTSTKRRTLLVAGATLAAPRCVLAQAPRQFRVGYLSIVDEASTKPFADAFAAGLRERGFVSGRNIVIDIRYAGGDSTRQSALVEELIALKPDVLVGIEGPAMLMQARTTTIPIVLLTSVDPVAAGLVRSLAAARHQRYRLGRPA